MVHSKHPPMRVVEICISRGLDIYRLTLRQWCITIFVDKKSVNLKRFLSKKKECPFYEGLRTFESRRLPGFCQVSYQKFLPIPKFHKKSRWKNCVFAVVCMASNALFLKCHYLKKVVAFVLHWDYYLWNFLHAWIPWLTMTELLWGAPKEMRVNKLYILEMREIP